MPSVTRDATPLAVARVTGLPRATADVLLTALIPFLALVAGAIHLVKNYLPMTASQAGGAPPVGAGQPPAGLMSVVGPHLGEAFLLNFVAYVVLAGLFVSLGRVRPRLRAALDVLLIVLSVATLAAWNAMGRANPSGLGTWALLAELLLIALAVLDAVRQLRPTRSPVAP
jgi:hypothetical protein